MIGCADGMSTRAVGIVGGIAGVVVAIGVIDIAIVLNIVDTQEH